MVFHRIQWCLPLWEEIPSGVIKHGVLENPVSMEVSIARKIIDKWSILQPAMFDYLSVTIMICNLSGILCVCV